MTRKAAILYQMNFQKILLRAASGWNPFLIFIASLFLLAATLSLPYLWLRLGGLCVNGLSGFLLCESMTGGRLWRMLNQQPSDNEGKTSITGHAEKDDRG